MLHYINENRTAYMARILIVEDDPMNAKLLGLLLSRKGSHEVVVARDPEEAIRYGTNGEVDLIIMDVSLQNWVYRGNEVNGVDLTKIIRQHPGSEDIPVLLATAHAMKNDREDLLRESGADEYFAKPISDHDSFVSKVGALLGKTKVGTEHENV
jgi:CheY-like chemotaxis protein